MWSYPCAGALPESERVTRDSVGSGGFRFRAGMEGRISVLRRGFGLDRCFDHGVKGMERWVGWGIVAHNLRQIARKQVGWQCC